MTRLGDLEDKMDRRAFLTYSSLSFASLLAGCGGGGSDTPPETGFGVFRSEQFDLGVGVTLVGVLPGGDFVVQKLAAFGLSLPGVVRRGSNVFTPIRFVSPDGGDLLEYISPAENPISVTSGGKVLVGLRSIESTQRLFLVDPLQGFVPPESEVFLSGRSERARLAPDDTIYAPGLNGVVRYKRTPSGEWMGEQLDTDFEEWRGHRVDQTGIMVGKTTGRFAQAAYIKDGVLTVLPRPFSDRYCEAFDYRPDGSVIGLTIDDEGFPRGVLWRGDSVVDLGREFIPRFFSGGGALLGGAPATIGGTPEVWVSPRVVRDGVAVPYKVVGPASAYPNRFPVLSLPDGTVYVTRESYSEFEMLRRAITYYELKPTF